MNILFDMETGDPDDLITLLLLVSNPDIKLRGVTCWQGSETQIGLIHHVLSLANLNIPVGGLNECFPEDLSSYYHSVVGKWHKEKAQFSPNEVIQQVIEDYPDTRVLTGAPLTNIANFITNNPQISISSITTQGGFLGNLVKKPLNKFKNKKAIKTYNLTQDPYAFNIVNNSANIKDLTFVTKDLCHGFLYTPEIHRKIDFGETKAQKLLKSCLEHYYKLGKNKALHDPLAMLFMIYPEIGERIGIEMSFKIDEQNNAIFSSTEGYNTRHGLISYDQEKAWSKFVNLCQKPLFTETNKPRN